MELTELEKKVNGMTNVQEACFLGYKEGYDKGYADAKRDMEKNHASIVDIMSCNGCMGAAFGDCDGCNVAKATVDCPSK